MARGGRVSKGPATGGAGEAAPVIICYTITDPSNNLTWNGDNSLDDVVISLVMQITCVVLFTQLLAFLLKPLRQPRVVAEILGGIIMGPSVLGNWSWFVNNVFPDSSISVLEALSNLGLIFFMFVVGLQMDLRMIKNSGRKVAVIAITSMIVPLLVGMVLAKPNEANKTPIKKLTFQLFFGIANSVTAFPVVARVLAELKILGTQLGQMAMSCALLTDVFSWFLLAVVIALAEEETLYYAAVSLSFSYLFFFFLCVFVIRPLVDWIIRSTPEGDKCKEVNLFVVVIGLFLCCYITNIMGIPSLFGAFIYGLIIPIGPFGAALVENLEDFVFGMLLPLFFTVSGLSTDLKILVSLKAMQWVWLLLPIILTCAARAGITFLLAIFHKMPFDEGLALGLLMNSKGVTEIIVLNIGKGLKIIDEKSFTIMVTVSVVTTCLVTPMIMMVYKPGRNHMSYKRTIQGATLNSELRILACIHTQRTVATTINLLESLQHNKKHPIYVYALHLMELTNRESAMLLVHNARKPGGAAVNRTQAQSDNINNAIEEYKQQKGILPIQSITSISPFSTMHENICNIAEDKRVSFIILPFHKYQTIDGDMECTNPAHRTINQNVLVNAPCSIGILVDRGLGSSKRAVHDHNTSHHVMVLFFGGADDREALAYALRMLEDHSIRLTILRFLPADEATESTLVQTRESALAINTDNDREKKIDNEFLNKVLTKTVNNKSVSFTDKIVNNGEETINVLRSIDKVHNLYIVGRGTDTSTLTSGLTDWNECPELGIIGDILASSDFALTFSVLVVQQYVGIGIHDGVETPKSSVSGNDFYVNLENIA